MPHLSVCLFVRLSPKMRAVACAGHLYATGIPDVSFPVKFMIATGRSLQKVQGHRTAQGHRSGVDVDVTPPTGGPVGHPPNPATLCDRNAQGSKS